MAVARVPQLPIPVYLTIPPNSMPYGQVWDPKTAIYIRNTLHLLGDFTGTLPKHIAQSQHLSLPLTLSTEELIFGRTRGWFTLKRDTPSAYQPSKEAADNYIRERRAIVNTQVEEAVVLDAEERRKRCRKRPREEVQQIDETPRKLPRLLEPLRAVWRFFTRAQVAPQDGVTEQVTREQSLAEKTRRQARQSALVTTATAARDDEAFNPDTIDIPLQSEKMAVFEDLHDKGYYISCGGKFGTDFLAYAGSPQLYHAAFAVVVTRADEPFGAREIVALGRLGDATRKRTLLAYVTTSGVRYVGIQWEETLP